MHRKALEIVNNNTLLHHMLTFLGTVPWDAIDESMPTSQSKTTTYQERFDAILPCLLTPNEHVRRTASKVVSRAFAKVHVMDDLCKSDKLSSLEYKRHLWSFT